MPAAANLVDTVDRLVRWLERDVASGTQLATSVRAGEGHGQAWIGLHDRWAIRLTVSSNGAQVHTLEPATGAWHTRALDSLDAVESERERMGAAVRAAIDELTVHRLRPGRRYRVAADFSDFHGHRFTTGETLVFERLDFLPYDDGYTLHFAERSMWIQGGSEAYASFGRLVVDA